MAYFIWRSDSPANIHWVESIDDGHKKMREAMAACHDRSIEWCLVHKPDDGGDFDTVACGRHGDLI